MTTTAPTFEIIGDGELPQAAIAALARLLLAVVDAEQAAEPDGGGRGDGVNTEA